MSLRLFPNESLTISYDNASNSGRDSDGDANTIDRGEKDDRDITKINKYTFIKILKLNTIVKKQTIVIWIYTT